jgi:hypothetical protein
MQQPFVLGSSRSRKLLVQGGSAPLEAESESGMEASAEDVERPPEIQGRA